jgi:hypothetical protein
LTENKLKKNVMNQKTVIATTYEHYMAGRVSGFGSFHTALLNLYRLADATNRKILEDAYPNWFVSAYPITPMNFCNQ